MQVQRTSQNASRAHKSVHAEELKVAKIQRTCVHDGPGIRTVLFFRGCGLRCLWCQNPELLSSEPPPGDDTHYSVDEVMEVIKRDKEYYRSTAGGVTLSGGDPLLQNPASLLPLLRLLKKEKIHVAVESALHVPWGHVEKALPYIDLFLIDLKVVGDDDIHLKYTKQDSKKIHSNIQKLIASKANIQFRTVAVPGFTDDERNIKATADFLKSVNHDSIALLKYYSMYEGKVRHVMGLSRASLNISVDQSLSSLRHAAQLYRSFDITPTCFDLDSDRHKAVFTKRIYDIQNAIRESDYHLCMETAKLKTKFYKKNGFDKPVHIHRAERLAYVLNNKKVTIYPNELVVGNFTGKRVGGNLWEEYYGTLLVMIIHQINHQTPVAFKCSYMDRLDFVSRILPFWAKHGLLGKINSTLHQWLLTVSRTSEKKVGFANNMAAIAHFIINNKRILDLGTTGIIEEIRAKKEEAPDQNPDFYEGMLIGLKALEDFAARYSDHLLELSKKEANPNRRRELEQMSDVCRRVPKCPARTFHEAVQSIMFLTIALCTESFENAISFGRLDQILYPYFKRDKEKGLITYDKAKELLACLIMKMEEVVLINDGDTYLGVGRLFESLSTDQTVTFGGVDQDGKDATNDLTYMLLDICELQPRGANMTARIHENSPQEYLDRIAEVYINGSPMPALYNDRIYIETLQRHYPTSSLQDSRDYSVVGCVEPNASDDHFGNTDCANMNITLPLLQALKGEDDDLWNFGLPEQVKKSVSKFVQYYFVQHGNKLGEIVAPTIAKTRKVFKKEKDSSSYNPPATMDELLERYQERLNRLAASILADHQAIEAVLRRDFTTPLASSLFKNCIRTGKDVYEGGAHFNSSGIQAVGVTDVADSLFALNEVVFKRKLYPMKEVLHAMDTNFEGERGKQIRAELLAVPKFGNDGSHEARDWVNRVLQTYVSALNSVDGCPRNGMYTAGYYALNVNIVYGAKTPALPSGRLGGVPLSHSIAPHYGMQMVDLVSALNSVAGVDFVKYAPNGTTITFTVDAGLFDGRRGVRNLAGLISAFFKQGGMQFQPNVISREILMDAYKNPEKHKYLLVRVAGYCAYFNELSDELKLAIINRTCYS